MKTYRQKRNFKRTPEPSELERKTSKFSEKSIFVVHEHWATHHHFDFRLQIGGVLKSWAIPKRPSQKVGEKRLAIQVEDHPLEYANFEGVIPEGQYGAGRVKIWDKGKVKFKRIEPKIIEFELFGKKLKGQFTLIRPKTFEKKNWLLLKNK